MRVLYAAKISESELKGDVEGSMNNHFKNMSDEPFFGLKVILGSLTIHLLEGEQSSVRKVLKNLNTHMQGTSPFYNHAWVLHFTDEVRNEFHYNTNRYLTKYSTNGSASL
jgi:hypothetical protein